MRTAVIVPTWKRQKKLQACLKGLEAQDMLPDLVVITVREEDTETCAFLSAWTAATSLSVKVLKVDAPGVVHAENMAMAFLQKEAVHDVVSFLDDDAVAPPDWVRNIKAFFTARPEAAAVGGPDLIVARPWTYHDVHVETVGKVTFLGKVIGNHHHRSTGVREVDVLKGVNMSVRREFLLPLDDRLQGRDPAKGNGVFWELDLCLKIKARGGHLFFDPSLLVQHDSNHDHFVPNHVMSSTSHNMTLVMMTHLPPLRRPVFLLYSLLIGHGNIRGLVKTAVDVLRRRDLSPLREFRWSMNGLAMGLLTWSKGT